MKSIFLAFIVLLTSTKCFAETFVYTDKATRAVIFITEKDNVVIDDSDKDKIVKTILPNDIAFYALTEAYSNYKLSGTKFILNTEKISAEEKAKSDAEKALEQKNTDFDSAKVKLMALGLTDAECESLR